MDQPGNAGREHLQQALDGCLRVGRFAVLHQLLPGAIGQILQQRGQGRDLIERVRAVANQHASTQLGDKALRAAVQLAAHNRAHADGIVHVQQRKAVLRRAEILLRQRLGVGRALQIDGKSNALTQLPRHVQPVPGLQIDGVENPAALRVHRAGHAQAHAIHATVLQLKLALLPQNQRGHRVQNLLRRAPRHNLRVLRQHVAAQADQAHAALNPRQVHAENRARRRRNRQLRAAPPQPRPPDHGGLHNDAFPDQLLHNLRYRRTGQTRHL